MWLGEWGMWRSTGDATAQRTRARSPQRPSSQSDFGGREGVNAKTKQKRRLTRQDVFRNKYYVVSNRRGREEFVERAARMECVW
ncbi:hypothetical protein C8J57DRAFT_1712678 [Mycena rebaudengoi]|nr:hypothetical protein C8J57DRAFT_1712678 [Mycena rebaudengoi]